MVHIILIFIFIAVILLFQYNISFFHSNLGKGVLLFVLLILFYIDLKLGLLTLIIILFIYKYEYSIINIHSYIINLDKNKNRYQRTISYYNASDINGVIPVDRFSAIYGKTVVLEDWLDKETIEEIEKVENNNTREYHHQLTRGGVGCFLSHLELYKRLIKDNEYNGYLIIEDDVQINPEIKSHIDYSLKNIPIDWDIILYSWIRVGSQPTLHSSIDKVDYFWGMQFYLINKRGAESIVCEVENVKIDGQIDSYLSRMCKQNKLNVYVYNKKIVSENSNQTDIQINIKHDTNIDPYDYKGYIMR